ncbi:MAG: hypothetical protein N2444_04890 [Methylocystis sp.]|nr:hypothetical protein [Methylocystis sp.]
MRRWLILVALFGAFGLGATLALSIAADAYLLFGARVIGNNRAPADMRLSTSGDREIKAVEIARLKAPLDAIFLGTSRTVFAFDPHSPTLSRLSTYNAGLNGSHSDEAAAILRYIVDHAAFVRRIVWNIDFEEFFREHEPQGDFAQSAFAGRPIIETLGRHALSYNALRKTIGGLLGQQPYYIDATGFYHYERRDGAATLGGKDFVDMPTLNEWFPQYMVMAGDAFEANASSRIAAIVDVIRYARAYKVAVDVVMMPTHVARRAMFDAAGLQPRFEQWKVLLAHALENAGAGAPLRVFDFCEIGPVATTRFAPGGPLERSAYFFEVLHPRPIVGDMMMARLLDLPSPMEPRDFGAPLAETSRPERLAADREALRSWERDNPDMMARILATVKAHDMRPASGR